MNTRMKLVATSLGAVALAGAVGVGISYADDPTTSPSPTPSATASAGQHQKKQGGHAKRALLRRALHGEVTLGGKKTRVIDFQRGTVDNVSSTSITVTSTDGFAGTYVVTKDTRVRQAGEPGKLTDLAKGDKVRVVATKDGKERTAKVIGEPRG